jgi:hypothetical protein
MAETDGPPGSLAVGRRLRRRRQITATSGAPRPRAGRPVCRSLGAGRRPPDPSQASEHVLNTERTNREGSLRRQAGASHGRFQPSPKQDHRARVVPQTTCPLSIGSESGRRSLKWLLLGQGCSTLQCHAAPGHGEAEGSRGRPVRSTSPFALFAYFAVQSSLLRRPYPAVTPGLTARKAPRQSAGFSTANNANRPATAQAPGEAFDVRTRVAGSDSLSLRSVNRER